MKDCDSRGACERVAAERRAVVPGFEDVGFWRRQARADGDATAEALGEGHHIRSDAVVLVSEPPSGAAEPGLHLVEDQKEALLVTPPAHAGEVAIAGGHDPDLPHDRLEHHRDRLLS